jgi:predicted ArsR family transcriptional regulator
LAESRKRILELLKRRGPLSANDLSRSLSLTTVTVRHHLEALIAGGLVGEPSPRSRAGPGRPELTYSITAKAEASLPRNDGELCACLMQALSQRLPPEQLRQVLQDAGRSLGSREGLGPEARPARRLTQAQAFLERRGYFPEWDPGSSRLTLFHCPYLEIAQASREVCHFDRALLEALLSAPVEILTRIADDDHSCTVAVEPIGL